MNHFIVRSVSYQGGVMRTEVFEPYEDTRAGARKRALELVGCTIVTMDPIVCTRDWPKDRLAERRAVGPIVIDSGMFDWCDFGEGGTLT